MLGITKTLERKAGILGAEPARHSPMRRVAEALDRRVAIQATIELVTEAIYRATELAYEVDRVGWVNADPVTGRMLIPAPWGKTGQRYWGLFPSESDTLRAILRHRQRGPVPALFLYDPTRRAWMLNLATYPDLSAAQTYLRDHPITVEEWRFFADKTRRKH